MKNTKINSIGFGFDKTLKISEGLIMSGIAMTIAGLAISHFKTQWWVARDHTSFGTVCELHEHLQTK